MLKELKLIIHNIEHPVLILHSIKDKLVPFRATKQITSTISSTDITIAKVSKGGHIILKDSGCDSALVEIDNWLSDRT